MRAIPLLDYERSGRTSRGWWCDRCNTYNQAVAKRIFRLPPFNCRNLNCNEQYLWRHDLDFSLTDVRVNGFPLVRRIFNQVGPECIANALCQMMETSYMVDSAFNNKAVEEWDPMRNLKPEMRYNYYYSHYPGHKACGSPGGPSGDHKLLKMLHTLRKDGIPLTNKRKLGSPIQGGMRYKVGDVTFMDRSNYNNICEELANGVPLLATIVPGWKFKFLKYGQFYNPPVLSPTLPEKLRKCSTLHERLFTHASHVVVLVGPGTNHVTGEKGFWAVNSWPEWCRRDDLPGFIEGHVTYGVGLIPHRALISNVVKLWKSGVSASGNPLRLVDEIDACANYTVKARNFYMLHGDLNVAAIPYLYNDPDVVYCPHWDAANPFYKQSVSSV